MANIKARTNTELRAMPNGREAGYIAYRGLMDQAGRVQNVAGFGDAQVAERLHDISVNFHYGILQDQVSVTTNLSPTVDSFESKLRIRAQTTLEEAIVQSRSAILYQSGYDAQGMFTASFTKYDGPAEVTQHVGIFDGSDGYVIGAAHGHLTVEHYRGGAEIAEIDQHNFNIDTLDGKGVSAYTIDISEMNLFRIQYGYLGVLSCIFEIWGGSLIGWIPFHRIEKIRGENTLLLENPYLPIRATVRIKSGTPSIPIEIQSGSWMGGTIGGRREYADLQYFAASFRGTIAGGTERPILSLANKTLFGGKTNRQRFDVIYMSASAAGNKPVYMAGYANAQLTGAVWTDVDANFSIAQKDIAATAWTGGRYMGDLNLGKDGNDILQFPIGQVRFNPGDSFLMTAYSATASDVSLTIRWGEAR